MSKDVIKRLVPKLRFPEFRDAEDWEAKQLIDVCKMQAGKFVRAADINEKKKHDMYPCYGANGLRGFTKTFTHAGRYSLIGRQGALCGNITLVTGEFHATEHAVVTTPKEGVDSNWLFYKLTHLNLNQYATGQAQPGLSVDNLERVAVEVSKKEEQQKIADCLSSIDELITAHSQKHQALKAHKKGLMQQLFPAIGETVPKLRFPEFRDAGDWEEQKTSDILVKVSNPVKVDPNKSYQQIGIRSHGKGIFFKDSVIGKVLGNKRVFWVEEDAFIANIVFAWELAIASTTLEHKGTIASHRFPMYKPKGNKSDTRYMKYFFLTHKGKELLWIASPGGAGRNKTLGQKYFEHLEFLAPGVEEQQKIANCLSSIDNLINTQAKKIESLKAHKKGLMQQLFPAADEVNG